MSASEVLLNYDGLGQAELIRRGEISSVELVKASIDRIEAFNGPLNAVVTPMYESALAEAETRSDHNGPFAGVPMLVKDLLAQVADVRLTEGSRSLENYICPEDSELVRRYRKAGLVFVGKSKYFRVRRNSRY